MKQLHAIQREILCDLLFSDGLRYSEIKTYSMENSKFMFHMNMLIKLGLVTKTGSKYTLTDPGKEYANRMTTEALKIDNKVKSTVVLCAIRNTSKETEFLIYKRLKQPFYGCMGFPTEKPLWGEKFSDAAVRGLKEETNLEGEPVLFGIRHYIIKNDKGVVLEDKLMYGYFFINPAGELKGASEGMYQWVKEGDLKDVVSRPLEEFWEFLGLLSNGENYISFEEISLRSDNF